MSTGFDLNRSKISEDTLATFIASPLGEELLDVPGVGASTKAKLIEHDITTSYQLISMYLRVCGGGMTNSERLDAFWYYLKELNVPGGTRSSIVYAVAEKVSTMIPDLGVN